MQIKSERFEANRVLQSDVKFENKWSSIATPTHAFTDHCFQLSVGTKLPFLDFRYVLNIPKSYCYL